MLINISNFFIANYNLVKRPAYLFTGSEARPFLERKIESMATMLYEDLTLSLPCLFNIMHMVRSGHAPTNDTIVTPLLTIL